MSDEIIFTGGGTEGDNMAIFGTLRTFGNLPSKHIITTKIEHHAVLEPLHVLEKDGVETTYLDVSEDGTVDPEDIKNALRPD